MSINAIVVHMQLQVPRHHRASGWPLSARCSPSSVKSHFLTFSRVQHYRIHLLTYSAFVLICPSSPQPSHMVLCFVSAQSVTFGRFSWVEICYPIGKWMHTVAIIDADQELFQITFCIYFFSWNPLWRKQCSLGCGGRSQCHYLCKMHFGSQKYTSNSNNCCLDYLVIHLGVAVGTTPNADRLENAAKRLVQEWPILGGKISMKMWPTVSW